VGYTADELPRSLVMSEGSECTRGMATGPSGYCTIRIHVAPDIPPLILERREISAFLLRLGFESATLPLIPLLERHYLTGLFQNPQLMKRGSGPSYTPDQLSRPLAMSEKTDYTR
jgi:hypothetical protein